MIYPNISLCESGCEIKGVDKNTMEAICECKFKNLLNQDFLGGDILMDNPFSEITDFISETNLLIIKCYKRFFSIKFISECYGGFIIIGLIINQIILTFVYYFSSLIIIKKYLFTLGNKYIAHLNNLKKNNNFQLSSNNNTNIFSYIDKLQNNKENPTKRKSRKNNPQIEETDQRKLSKKTINEYENKNSRFIVQNRKKKGKIINIKKDNINKNKSNTKGSNKFLVVRKFSSSDISPRSDSPPTNLEFSDEKKQIEKKSLNSKDDFNIDIQEFLSPELDETNFDDVIKNDKRTFKEYYFEKIKSNQMIFNIILENEPLKPKTMKVILLIINIIKAKNII